MTTGSAPPLEDPGLGSSGLPHIHVPPPPRPGLVPRERLLARLGGRPEVSLIVVCAPAGFGKTTLLTQWAELRAGRPVAWLTLTRSEADPVVFIGNLVEAFAEVAGPADPRLSQALGGAAPRLSTRVIPLLRSWVQGIGGPVSVVLDDADALSAPQSLEALEIVAGALPPGSFLALTCRQEPRIGLASLRGQRRLAEIGPQDLAMDAVEADALLRMMDVRLTDDEVLELTDRTEGWPAGLVLAGAALAGRTNRHDALQRFAGGNPQVSEYFEEEVLRRAPDDQVRLLLQTSILEELTPEACTAVAGERVSAKDLERLHRRIRFTNPLAGGGERYRHHRLFTEMLRAELARRDPDAAAVLHARAADWFEANRDPLAAVRHRLQAGDVEAAAGLVWRCVPEYQTNGRLGTLRAIMAEFSPAQIAENPPVALAMAFSCIDSEAHRVAHYTRLAAGGQYEGPLPGGPQSVAAAVSILRAVIAADGIKRMAEDAALGASGEPDNSAWLSLSRFLQGVAAHLLADHAAGDRLLSEGSERAGSTLGSVYVLCESARAVFALLRGDPSAATRHAGRADSQVAASQLHDYASTALLRSLQALMAARRGEHDESRDLRRRSQQLLVRNDDVMPWFGLTARILLARAAILCGDQSAAEMFLAEAGATRRRVPDSPFLEEEYLECLAAAEGLPPGAFVGPEALSTAELRVLRFLPTHLNYREIGERVHLSQFTIKSQAGSIFRKLGVASRSEAVERARSLGLLES